MTFREKRLVESKEFPDKPLDPVSSNGVGRLFGNRYPQSPYAQAIFFQNHCKMFCLISFSRPIYIDKI